MSVYVTSDIHGEYDLFMSLLKKINFSESDTLYILGDIVDRGPHPIKLLLRLMEMPNVICLAGNHELMALEGMKFLMTEITEDSINALDKETIGNIADWIEINGGHTTVNEFKALDSDKRKSVYEYIRSFLIYEELYVAGKSYFMVHAGLGNYDSGKDIEDYSLKELLWDRAEYDICYFDDRYVITGHTPTQEISGNIRPGYIYRKNNHIGIDCGCNRTDGHLAAFCLDTEVEYYVSKSMTEI